jgi:hypothetical protein
MSKSPSDADDGEGGWGVPALSANGVPTNNKRGRDDLEGNAPMVDGGADELGSHTSTQVLCRFLTCCVSVIGQTQIQGSHSGPSKRKRYVPSSSTARYQLFHRVTCGGGGFHVNHNTFADYLDSPKLFAGDSKGNVLRGKERVVVKDYLEDRPEIAFTVYRLHNCNSYHDEIEDDFDRLPMLPIDPNIISLRVEGQNAKPFREHIQITSPNLTAAISEAEAEIGRTLVDFDSSETTDLLAPYLPFYHSRDVLTKLVSDCNTTL